MSSNDYWKAALVLMGVWTLLMGIITRERTVGILTASALIAAALTGSSIQANIVPFCVWVGGVVVMMFLVWKNRRHRRYSPSTPYLVMGVSYAIILLIGVCAIGFYQPPGWVILRFR